MKFGLFPMPQASLEKAPEALADEMIEQVAIADDHGWDVALIGQHFLTAEYNELQPFPLLGRLAAETDSMTLGTGIILLPLQHPINVAEQLATLSVLAEDLIIGIGLGYRDAEFENFGIPKGERVPRFIEGVSVLKRLLSERNVSYEGEFYSLTDATINPRPASMPPIWIAANADVAIKRAARLGDAWFINPHSALPELAEQKRVYDRVREEQGDPTQVPLLRETVVAETTAEAWTIALEHLAPKYDHYIDWGQNEAMEDSTEFSRAFEDLAADRFLIGTPEEVCEQIERFDDALNVSHLLFRMQWPGMDNQLVTKTMELLTDEVLPAL